jgi:hypothetical protein
MRSRYTAFKAHRRSLAYTRGMPTTVQTSMPAELLGVGDHLVERLEMLESALRRGSLTISEASEAQSMSDGTTAASSRRSSGQLYLQQLRQRLDRHRPRSSPYPLYSNSRLRPIMRNSADTLVPRDRESNLSVRGQVAPSRLSQSTTMYTSTPSIVRLASQEAIRPGSSDESNMASQESTPSLNSTPQASPDSRRQA